MATKQLFMISSWETLERPNDWNPSNNKFEVVAPGAQTGGLPPGIYADIQGGAGGSYAFAVNVDCQFPITFYHSGNTMSTYAGFQDAVSNVICLAGASSVSPQGNLGGGVTMFGGGGAGGPDGPGADGDFGTGGMANAGFFFYWYDPDTGIYYRPGWGGAAPGYGGNVLWGYGSGPAGAPNTNPGFFTGGPGLGVITYEPFVAQAAMVTIM